MTWSQEISQLVTEVDQLTVAVNAEKTLLSNTAIAVESARLVAANNATLAANSAASSLASAQLSETHKNTTLGIYGTQDTQQTSVLSARSSAFAASSSATTASASLLQNLSGINTAALHRSPNAITSLFVYDTLKDSDGGAWTEKCGHTSWYNETLSGNWLGANASEIEARRVGATLGPEMVTNGDFSSGTTGWTVGSAWSINNGVATEYATNTYSFLDQAFTFSAGKTYRVSLTISNFISGPAGIIFKTTNSTVSTFTTNGTYTFDYTADGAETLIRMGATTVNGRYSVDNISIREIISLTTVSNDYYQSTTDGKFYRLWKNILRYSDTLDLSAWTLVTGATRSNVIPGATRITDSSTTAGQALQFNTQIGTGTYTLTMDFDRQASGYFGVTFGGQIFVDHATLTVNTSFVAGSTSVTQVSGSRYKLVVSGITLSSLWYFTIRPSVGVMSGDPGGGAGMSSTGYLDVYNVQIENGSVATSYESKGAEGSISEVFRGNKRDFPKLSAIVTEAQNITIYDLTEPGRPMWMRFAGVGTNGFGALWAATPTLVDSKAASGIIILAGGSSTLGVGFIDLLKDTCQWMASNTIRAFIGNLSQRQVSTIPHLSTSGTWIINSTVNTVAMTMLPDAPADPATGLRVPTIAAATNSGLSIIKNNGVVVNSSATHQFSTVVLHPDIVIVGRGNESSAASTIYYLTDPNSASPAFNMSTVVSSAPYIGAGNTNQILGITRSEILRRHTRDSSLIKVRFNETTPTRSLVSYIAPTFNTGWMVGDSRRCFLSDVEVAAAIGPELVVNGTFDTDAGWTTTTGWSIAAGRLDITNAAQDTYTGQTGIFTAGKTYRIQFDRSISTGQIRIETWTGGVVSGSRTFIQRSIVGTGKYTIIFTAPANGGFTIQADLAGVNGWIDNISIREVVTDRSYKAQGADINGTLTRAKLASGTSLVSYSNWSNTNYLSEPYSADLDFGTGEFSASTWVNIPAALSINNFPVVGAEIVSNGSFTGVANGTDIITLPGWLAYGSPTARDIQSEQLRLTANTTGQGALFVFTAVVGKAYRVSFNYSGTGVGNVYTNTSLGNTQQTISGTGSQAGIFVAGQTSMYIYFRANDNLGTGTGYFDNISIREVSPVYIFDRSTTSGPRLRLGITYGGQITAEAFDGITTRMITAPASYNNASWIKASVNYTTDGSLTIRVNGREVAVTRGTPLLSLNSKYNLLTRSAEFENTAWLKDGTTFANGLLSETAVTAGHGIYFNGTLTIPSGVSHRLTFRVQYVNVRYIAVGLYDSGGTATAGFDLVSGVSTGTGSTGVGWSATNPVITLVSPGVFDCSVTVVSGAANTTKYPALYLRNSAYTTGAIASNYTGNVSNQVGLIRSQIELGTTATTYQRVGIATDFDFQAPLTIGNSFAINAPFPGSIALLKLSATVPTPEQESFMYEQEKQLFRAGTQSVLPDAGSIVDMSYDDATDRWVTASATNESYWTGLTRNSVTAVPAGSYSRIFATSGVELSARTTTNPGVDVTIPAYALRDEFIKRAEAANKLNKQLATYDYVGGFTGNITTGSTSIASVANLTYPTSYIGARIAGTGIPTNAFITGVSGTTIYISAPATATTTGLSITFLDFILPTSMEAKIVMSAGTIRREGSTSDYTRLYDGFKETIRFATAPGATAWVQIQAIRTQQ